MVVFEYGLWIANPTLFLLVLILSGPVSLLRRGRARRALLLAWSGLLGLLALIMSLNLILQWPQIPTILAEFGLVGWAVPVASALLLLVALGFVLVPHRS